MPGSPATTPNIGIPRFSDSDTASFSAQVNSVSDAIDACPHIHQPGDIIWSAAATRAGALLCDGSPVSRTTYATLYAALGGASSPWGQGDGSTTFNVPDFRGRSPVGPDTAGVHMSVAKPALGATGGEEQHQLSVTEMPAHSHTDNGHGHAGSTTTGSPFSGQQGAAGGEANRLASPSYGNVAVATGFASLQNTGGGGKHNNMHPYVGLNAFVKT